MPEINEVIIKLQKSQLSSLQKLRALRAVSVHMYLSTQQCRGLLRVFASQPQDGQVLQKESRDVQDAFCILHTRVTDRGYLLGPELLHASQSKEGLASRPLVKPDASAPWQQRQTSPLSPGDREALSRRLGILHLINPLRPELVRIECNFAVREQRKVMAFLLQLATLEQAGQPLVWNIKGTKKIYLPMTWYENGPPVDAGEFLVSYESWGPNMSVRYAVAEQYTVGFYGPRLGERTPGLGEKTPSLIPVRESIARQSQYC